MNILELKNQIIKNEMSNFYVFVGEEIGIINIYLKQMSNKLALPMTRADSVSSIYTKCTTRSMFGNTTGFYVIRDDREFTKQDSVFSKISKDIGKNVIVLLYDKLDTRTKFSKAFKDQIVIFEKLTSSVLHSYLKKEIAMSDENLNYLAEVCNYSYDMCMLEIDKIKQYADSVINSWTLDEPIAFDDDTAFRELLGSGVIYQPEETDVFKFTDAVCSRKKVSSFELEKILRENNNSGVNILGTLYSSIKSVLLIQVCPKGSNISEITGLDNGHIYFNKKYVGAYSSEKLVEALKLIYNVIEGIKSGKIEDEYSVRYVLVKIL